MPSFYYSLGFFGALNFLGDVYPGLIDNKWCYPYVGCNVGFFGMDALVHFCSGICIALGLLWLKRQGTLAGAARQSCFIESLQFLSWSALVGVLWEAMEFGYDQFRAVVLHTNLLVPSNILTQPSNADTMGDLLFGCAGTLAVYLLYRYTHRH